MRLLILLACTAGLIAAEPATTVPILELAYGGGGPTPAPALATAWQGSCTEAVAWWSTRIGLPLTAGDLACTNLHLVAATSLRPGAQPRAVVAGRWQGASPALTATWKGVTGRWPERIATVTDGDLLMASAGLPAPAAADVHGWRMTLHGAGIAAEADSMLGTASDEDPLLRWSRMLQWQLLRVVADLDPAGTGSVTLNLPPAALAVPDVAVVERVPTDAALAGAVALDGAHATSLPVPWDELCKNLDCTRDEAVSALAGTWAAVIYSEKRCLFAIPASPLAIRLTTELVEAPLISERWRDQLLIATDPGLITDWKREPAAPMSGGELGVVRCDLGQLATVLAEMHDESALDPFFSYLPLPQTLVGNCGLHGEKIARELGFHGAQSPDMAALAALLAGAGPQSLRLGRSPEGWLRLDLDGSVLPWLLPAAALRWFADEAENQEGCVELRRVIAQLQADGSGALPSDLLTGVPAPTDAELDAGIAAWTAMDDGGHGAPEPRLAETGLPTAEDIDSKLLAQARDFCARSAGLPASTAGTLDLRQAQRQGQLDATGDLTCQIAVRVLTRAGRLTALTGDLHGVDACDRALTLAGAPTNVLIELVRFSVLALRDDAYLAMIMRGQLTTDRFQAWQVEPFPADLKSAWHGERLLSVGSLADHWLELSGPRMRKPRTANQLADDQLAQACSQFVLAPRAHRAWTAEDLANTMHFFSDLEHGRKPAAPPTPFRSPLIGMTLPAFSWIQAGEQKSLVRHHLVRLCARVVQLARAGNLPADAAALASALGGPLVLTCGGLTLPVVYERRSDHGFRLAIDATGDAPSGILNTTWRGWQKAKPRSAGTKLAFPGNIPELVWDGIVQLPATSPKF